ncbi:hypothetical protein NMY22_g8201 [Coprinellus aureogranulatus]|nr:hypothetical protein NMY22_g8201 [Coprinellus aureogranulatus]
MQRSGDSFLEIGAGTFQLFCGRTTNSPPPEPPAISAIFHSRQPSVNDLGASRFRVRITVLSILWQTLWSSYSSPKKYIPTLARRTRLALWNHEDSEGRGGKLAVIPTPCIHAEDVKEDLDTWSKVAQVQVKALQDELHGNPPWLAYCITRQEGCDALPGSYLRRYGQPTRPGMPLFPGHQSTCVSCPNSVTTISPNADDIPKS